MNIELKRAAQDAAEAIDWLLKNIRLDAPQLSGKAMGNAEKCATALRAALAQQPVTPGAFVVEIYDPISHEWALAHSSPFWTQDEAQHAAACIRHTTRVRPFDQQPVKLHKECATMPNDERCDECQQPANAIACGIPGMAKTTCPYCELSFTFEHEQPSTTEPVHQIRKAFTQDAEWAWRDATEEAFHMHPKEHRRILYTHAAPSVPATGESIGQVFYAADGGGDDETGVGYHMKPYVHWFSKALAAAAAADTKLYTRPVPSLPDSITPPTEDGTEYDYSSGHAAKQDAAALNWIERQYLEELGMG